MMFSSGSKRNIAKKRVTANAPTMLPLDNPSLANALILYPLKTPENRNFSDVFRGIKREHWEEKGYGQCSHHAPT